MVKEKKPKSISTPKSISLPKISKVTIPNQLANTRYALTAIRAMWNREDTSRPIYLGQIIVLPSARREKESSLSNEVIVEEFALRFVIANHIKQKRKNHQPSI